MKAKLLVLMALASVSAFAETHFSIGVNLGGYPAGYYAPAPPPPPPVYYAPPNPGPGYVWISGYYNRVGPRYVWRAGYWSRPPYAGAVWVGPRYAGRRYYEGHWRRRR
jgi:hypothetical protein